MMRSFNNLGLNVIVPICVLYLVCGCAESGRSNLSENNKSLMPEDIVVGSYYDGCDIMFEGMPRIDSIPSKINLTDRDEEGIPLKLSGMVLKADGSTPAPNIILYVYHTNAQGIYKAAPNQKHGKMHGAIRGWVKTNAGGEFNIETIKPNSYPDRNFPAHLHFAVKEPGKTPYYIDEIWFDDDHLVTVELRTKAENRGGNQIIQLISNDKNDTLSGQIQIMLGLNIPNYK